MKKTKKNDKNQERLQEAVYKFKFTKEQNRDLQIAFEIFDKDGTGNIDIKDLKVILRALGFEPQEDEIKKLLSKNVLRIICLTIKASFKMIPNGLSAQAEVAFRRRRRPTFRRRRSGWHSGGGAGTEVWAAWAG